MSVRTDAVLRVSDLDLSDLPAPGPLVSVNGETVDRSAFEAGLECPE